MRKREDFVLCKEMNCGNVNHRARKLYGKGTQHTCDFRVGTCVFERMLHDRQLDECTHMIEQAYSMLDMNVVGFVHRGVSTT